MKKIKIAIIFIVFISLLVLGITIFNFENINSNQGTTILFASDYQGDNRKDNANKILQVVKKYTNLDLFVMCGDYQTKVTENYTYSEYGISELSSIFKNNFDSAIPQFYVQGNHDPAKTSGLAEEGIHELDKYIIYVINEDSFPNHQKSQEDQKTIVTSTAEKLSQDLQTLVDRKNDKPIFIATHVPLHYTRRLNSTDNAYAGEIIKVLNEYGKKQDIIYLFGHNHSGNYDDNIGGSINYIEKGSTMHIGGSNIPTNINFTYLNAGYIGYTKNSTNSNSTNELSATAITVNPTNLIIQKYTKKGPYYHNPIIVNLTM